MAQPQVCRSYKLASDLVIRPALPLGVSGYTRPCAGATGVLLKEAKKRKDSKSKEKTCVHKLHSAWVRLLRRRIRARCRSRSCGPMRPCRPYLHSASRPCQPPTSRVLRTPSRKNSSCGAVSHVVGSGPKLFRVPVVCLGHTLCQVRDTSCRHLRK